MINTQSMTAKEVDIYCDLLPIAYKIYLNKTGLVCGAEAERIRDELWHSTAKIICEDWKE